MPTKTRNDFQVRERIVPLPPLPPVPQIGTREAVIAGQRVTVRVFAPGGHAMPEAARFAHVHHDGGARVPRRSGAR